jgi:hypothetical protein
MSAARGFLGAGDLYTARFNSSTGLFDAYKGPFEAGKFEIKPNTDVKDLVSKSRANYGGLLESVNLPKPFDFTAEMRNIDKDAMAIALLGTTAPLTQTSGTVTSGSPESVVATLDGWSKLAHLVVSSVVVKNAGDTTTYVLGTDYVVNSQLGWIKPLSTGSIVDASTMHVSYGYATIASTTRISGGTSPQIRAKMMLDGVNFVDGSKCIVEALEVTVAASSAFDFLADDFNSLTLAGRMKTPVGGTTPFTVDLYPTS